MNMKISINKDDCDDVEIHVITQSTGLVKQHPSEKKIKLTIIQLD
jgi:hypothetical protein